MNRPFNESAAVDTGAVAEMQGLYGAFSFPERLLQKIWQRGDYDGAKLSTNDGRKLKVGFAGRWNQLGGPDFLGARLSFQGQEISGDIELHLNERDWANHGHANDPAYQNVVLHVVLFPCSTMSTIGAGGRAIPILCLLPSLYYGLEEYAGEDAMEKLAGRPLSHTETLLGACSVEELDTLLDEHAKRRWLEKVHYAKGRIERLGWADACHHVALEVLGYRFNRSVMLKVASAYPLAEWVAGRVEPEEVWREFTEEWTVQGMRPLNHPRLRLRQYAAWCGQRPDWPERLRQGAVWRELAECADNSNTLQWRRAVKLSAVREALRADLCADIVSGSRFDNLVADGFMPLLAASGLDTGRVWRHWFVGDVPDSAIRALRSLGVLGDRGRPAAQGVVQGLLGWWLTQVAAGRF